MLLKKLLFLLSAATYATTVVYSMAVEEQGPTLSRQKRTILSGISSWWYGEPATEGPSIEDLEYPKEAPSFYEYAIAQEQPNYDPGVMDPLPHDEDLTRLARELGIKNLQNMPRIEDVMGLMGTTTKRETIEAIRDFASTPGGREVIESYLSEEPEYEDNGLDLLEELLVGSETQEYSVEGPNRRGSERQLGAPDANVASTSTAETSPQESSARLTPVTLSHAAPSSAVLLPAALTSPQGAQFYFTPSGASYARGIPYAQVATHGSQAGAQLFQGVPGARGGHYIQYFLAGVQILQEQQVRESLETAPREATPTPTPAPFDAEKDREETNNQLLHTALMQDRPRGFFQQLGYWANFLNPFAGTEKIDVPHPTEQAEVVTVLPPKYIYPEGYDPITKTFKKSSGARARFYRPSLVQVPNGQKVWNGGRNVPQLVSPYPLINTPIPAFVYQSSINSPLFSQQYKPAGAGQVSSQYPGIGVSVPVVPFRIDLTNEEYDPGQITALRQQLYQHRLKEAGIPSSSVGAVSVPINVGQPLAVATVEPSNTFGVSSSQASISGLPLNIDHSSSLLGGLGDSDTGASEFHPNALGTAEEASNEDEQTSSEDGEEESSKKISGLQNEVDPNTNESAKKLEEGGRAKDALPEETLQEITNEAQDIPVLKLEEAKPTSTDVTPASEVSSTALLAPLESTISAVSTTVASGTSSTESTSTEPTLSAEASTESTSPAESKEIPIVGPSNEVEASSTKAPVEEKSTPTSPAPVTLLEPIKISVARGKAITRLSPIKIQESARPIRLSTPDFESGAVYKTDPDALESAINSVRVLPPPEKQQPFSQDFQKMFSEVTKLTLQSLDDEKK